MNLTEHHDEVDYGNPVPHCLKTGFPRLNLTNPRRSRYVYCFNTR